MKTAASITVQYDNVFSPFPAKEWREGFRWAKESGLDGVELIFSDPKLLDLNAITTELDRLDLDVATLATGQATVLEGFSLSAYSEELRSQAVSRLYDDIDFSVALGSFPNVTVGLIRGRGNTLNFVDERSLFTRELLKVAEYAYKKGVKLNLEPINRYEVSLLNSVEETATYLDELGNPPNIGILYDSFHVNIEDRGQKATLERFTSKLSHVHFADSNRRLPGEGHINFQEIVQSLKTLGYNNWISLEVLSQPSASHVQKETRAAMRKLFKNNSGKALQ